MRGIKRRIPLEKIEKKDSRAVAFSKRSKGLYSKASELCLLSGGQIAIIATPVSSKSNVSFYSFGHSSVDGVVDAFLANKRPLDDLGQGFWWEDESLVRSDNTEELRDAMNSMSKMLQDLKDLRFDEDVKMKGVLHATHQNQALDLQSSSSSSSTLCIQGDPTAYLEGFNKNTEEQILAISDNSNNCFTGSLDGCNQEFGLDQIFDFVKSECPSMNLETDDVSLMTTNQNQLSDSEAVEGGGELVMHKDWHENNLHLSDVDENQILSISDNKNALPGNEDWCDQELDLDQIIDFETNCESLLMNLENMYDISMMTANQNQCYDSEAVEDGGSVIHRDLDEDDLRFSDFETNCESLLMNFEKMNDISMMTENQNQCYDSEAVEDGGSTIHRDLDEDNLHLSDIFNELASISAL